MEKTFFKILSYFSYFFFAAAAIGLQTTFFALPWIQLFQPRFLLCLLLWIAVLRPFYEGGCYALIFAHLAELHSSAPQGIYYISFMFFFFMVRFSRRYFLIQNLWTLLMLILFLTWITQSFQYIILETLHLTLSSWLYFLTSSFFQSLSTTLVSFWIFPLLEKWDLRSYRLSKKYFLAPLEIQAEKGDF